jgi:FkbM family methyltransferase
MKDLKSPDGNLNIRTSKAIEAYKVMQNYNLAFDIGTNVGGFSNAYHGKFNKIVAIEAHPLTYETAKNNLSNYPNIEVINRAVSDLDDVSLDLFLFSNEDSGSTSILNTRDSSQTKDRSHQVNSISYNSLVKQYGVPQYMKIDCEGGEYNFLMNQDLSGIEFMAIEIHYRFLTTAQQKDLLEHLLKYFNIHSHKKGIDGVNHPEYNLIKK